MSPFKKSGTGINPLLLTVIYGNMTMYGFIISMRGVSFPLIKNSFGASYSDQGLMTAMVSFTAVCFCIIAGLFMGRMGLKKTALAGFILMLAGMLSMRFAGSFWMAAGFYLILQGGFGFFEIGLNGMGVRIFTVKSALMINLLHFFFGLGSIGGPFVAGFLVNNLGMQWQMIYPLNVIPVLVFLTITLAARFPETQESADSKRSAKTAINKKNESAFLTALREPAVWIIGMIMGLSGALESCSVAWSGLFLQDVYGMNIEKEGAVFVSVFFLVYTLSRLAAGFYIEKAGYLKVTIAGSFAALAIYIISFCLGRGGIYLLPLTGIFIAIVYPTMLAISVGVFKERAQSCSSAIISIAFILNGLIQFGFGLTNNNLGASWAFRSCVPYTIIMLILMFVLGKMTKNSGTANACVRN